VELSLNVSGPGRPRASTMSITLSETPRMKSKLAVAPAMITLKRVRRSGYFISPLIRDAARSIPSGFRSTASSDELTPENFPCLYFGSARS
jgi:hypothetical protein